MHKLTKVILTGLCLSASAFCQDTVPHTFEPGTPAKAAEVNENFQTVMQKAKDAESKADANASDLDDVRTDIASLNNDAARTESEIGIIESRVTALESSGGGAAGGADDPSEVHFTYTKRTVAVGETVPLGGADHRQIRVPFIDFYTGDQYAIEFPSVLSQDGTISENIQMGHFALHAGTTGYIDSYPVRIRLAPHRTINISQSSSQASSSLYLYVWLYIEVGGGELLLSGYIPSSVYDRPDSPEQKVFVEKTDGDFTDDLSHEAMTVIDREVVKAYLDDYVDYIKIERVSP